MRFLQLVIRYSALPAVLLGQSFAAALAYSPPVDTVGPLTVRIEGPETVGETETPLPVRVVLENKAERPIEGTLQLGVIDRWRAEPAAAVPFRVAANGTTAQEFKVTAGEGTFSGHYPIHAFARFSWEDKSQTVHPILIVETKLPKVAQSAAVVVWKPLSLPPDGQLALCRVPVRRAVVQVFGEKPQTMPVGWEGTEPRTKANLRIEDVTVGGQKRPGVCMHPPWEKKQVGTIVAEFPVQLPNTKPLRLSFANAVIDTGHGDGVTFRVRVVPLDAPEGTLGTPLFDRHTAAKSWQEGEVDLSAWAGQAIRLQLESHPGPKNDTGWDQSYWADPTLVAGTPPAPVAFPPKDNAGSRLLGTISRGQSEYQVRLWPGRRGLLDAAVGFVQGDKRLFFHGFEVRVLGGRIDDAGSSAVLMETKEEPCGNGCQIRHRFADPAATFDLVARLYVEQGVLRASFHLENAPPPRPWWVVYLEDVAAGPWCHKAQQVYAGHGNVVRDPQAHTLGFEGHRLSTSFVGFDFDGPFSLVQAVDVPPDRLEVRPAERHYTLHTPHACTLSFIPAANVFDAVKVYRDTNGLKPAGGVSRLAGRFVFDLWHGRYGESGESLKKAFRYGLTDAVVVWHNWQRWGYDYRLPEINPPNPQWGTTEELRATIEVCKQAGVLFALHDNYIDYYPDAEGFSYEKTIAFDRNQQPVKAWFNQGRAAQSYRYRVDAIEPILHGNLKWLRDTLTPDAYFIDVWSSLHPYDYWTADGKFFDRVCTRATWGQHFAWIRELLGGQAPQISESGHDQLIGWLDGGQSNHVRAGTPLSGYHKWFTWDWKCADAERIPWLDAAHHDRFVLHGAGYPGRYEAGLDPRTHGIYSDDYMATEVLTGHPGMVSQPFGRDVVRKYWLLADLMRALALRQIEQVEFVGGDMHRQHVVWSGGGEVWVNRGESDWSVAGYTLPQYGFFARVDGKEGPIEAAIARRDGIIVEWSRSPQQTYVNGRADGDDPSGPEAKKAAAAYGEAGSEALRARQNPTAKPIDFGALTTAGGCRLTRDGERLLLTLLPSVQVAKTSEAKAKPAEATFAFRLRPAALPWRGAEPTHAETVDEDGKTSARRPLRRDGESLLLDCEPGVFAYRLLRE
jgi:hypothetical protein